MLPSRRDPSSGGQADQPGRAEAVGTTAPPGTDGRVGPVRATGEGADQRWGGLVRLPELEASRSRQRSRGCRARTWGLPRSCMRRAVQGSCDPEFRPDRAAIVLIAPTRCSARGDRRAGASPRHRPEAIVPVWHCLFSGIGQQCRPPSGEASSARERGGWRARGRTSSAGTRVIHPGPGLPRDRGDRRDPSPAACVRTDASERWRSKEAEADGALVR